MSHARENHFSKFGTDSTSMSFGRKTSVRQALGQLDPRYKDTCRLNYRVIAVPSRPNVLRTNGFQRKDIEPKLSYFFLSTFSKKIFCRFFLFLFSCNKNESFLDICGFVYKFQTLRSSPWALELFINLPLHQCAIASTCTVVNVLVH